MENIAKVWIGLVSLLLVSASAGVENPTLDERAANIGEWGFRPGEGAVLQVNPPSFTWRYQKELSWELQCARDMKFNEVEYRIEGIKLNVHCPDRVFPPGTYTWHYRGRDSRGRCTKWSRSRTFSIAGDAGALPLPGREELMGRIPTSHPRLFVRPENLAHLRELARGKMKHEYDNLVKKCERILHKPPSTEEPPKYPKGIVRGSDSWREIWWGNRRYVISALDGAANLAFTRLIGGPDKYGLEAKRILLECARWDPQGSTGYRYNDEAGMPYAYYFSRTYTFVNDLLTDEEKKICRQVMKVRGDEMYHHLWPRHHWRPYASHSNRAWHFLGEMGIAFKGEIETAEDWLWFAANVFFNMYPVWSGDDGGWHEGMSYWSSYQNRFTWWADVMREALGINAYDKPFYAKAGYYAMYLMPPGKIGGGFGDLTAKRTTKSNVPLMSVFAAQANNGHWQWYVEQLGGPVPAGGYIGFIRGALPEVRATPPDDLPGSRLFRGIGQAYLNTNLTNADRGVQLVFKSSPFGTQSHGYEANNSFLLWGYGKRLLIRSGYRDSYGSKHHRDWMWSTRSVNNITVNGQGQLKRSAAARGEIVAFKTTPWMDIVVGEAGPAYQIPIEYDSRGRAKKWQPILNRFTRAILFAKPELVVVYDRLEAREPATFEYWLHALRKISVDNQHSIRVRNGNVVCDINFLTPAGLTFSQTDQYDPNPRPRIKLREWHLTAATAQKSRQVEFVTIYQVHRIEDRPPSQVSLKRIKGGYSLEVKLSEGEFAALLPTDETAVLTGHGLQSKGAIKVRRQRTGAPDEILSLEDQYDHN